jgi:alanyl-tRNA synthetase
VAILFGLSGLGDPAPRAADPASRIPNPEGAHPCAVVIARAPDATLDCTASLKRLTAQFGGKGGGRAEMAQGGGLQGTREELVAFARTLL